MSTKPVSSAMARLLRTANSNAGLPAQARAARTTARTIRGETLGLIGAKPGYAAVSHLAPWQLSQTLGVLGFEGAMRFHGPFLLAPSVDGSSREYASAFYPHLVGRPGVWDGFADYVNGTSADQAVPREPWMMYVAESRGPFAVTSGGRRITGETMFHLLRRDPAAALGDGLEIVGGTRPYVDIRKLAADAARTGRNIGEVLLQQMRAITANMVSVRGSVQRMLDGGYARFGELTNDWYNFAHFTALPENARAGAMADFHREARTVFGDSRDLLVGTFAADVLNAHFGLSGAPAIPTRRVFSLMDIAFRAVMEEVDLGGGRRGYVQRNAEDATQRLKAAAKEMAALLGPQYAGHFGQNEVELMLRLALYQDSFLQAREAAFRAKLVSDGVVSERDFPAPLVDAHGNEINALSSPRHARPFEIIIVVGASGVGKTSLLYQWREQGLVDGIIPVVKGVADTSREIEESPPAGFEGEPAEVTVRETRFAGMVHSGQIKAVEGSYGRGYGIRLADLERAALTGGRWAVAVGPTIARHLDGVMGAIHSDFGFLPATDGFAGLVAPNIKVLFVSAEKGKIQARLMQREQETGRLVGGREVSAEEVDKLLRENGAGYGLGREIISHPFEIRDIDVDTWPGYSRDQLGSEAMRAAKDIRDLATPSPRLIPAMHNGRRELVERGLVKIRAALTKGEITAEARAAAKAMFFELFYLSMPAGDERYPVTFEEDAWIDVIVEHSLEVVMAARRARTGELLHAEGARPLKRLEKVAADTAKIFTTLSEDELFYLMVEHDFGKAFGRNEYVDASNPGRGLRHPTGWLHLHDAKSYRLVSDGHFLVGCKFPEIKGVDMRRVGEGAIKYHHTVGNAFQAGQCPFMAMADAMRDPEVDAVLKDNKSGNINRAAAEALVNRLFAIAVADVGGKGFLSLTRAQTYLWARQQMLDIFCPKKEEATYADTRKRLIAFAVNEETVERRFAVLAATLDVDAMGRERMDLRPGGIDVEYRAAVGEALSGGSGMGGISRQNVSDIYDAFHRVHTPYADLFGISNPHRAPGTEPDSRSEDIRLDPALTKFAAMLSGAVLAADRSRIMASDSLVDFIVVDKDGNPPRVVYAGADGSVADHHFGPQTRELKRVLGEAADVSTTTEGRVNGGVFDGCNKIVVKGRVEGNETTLPISIYVHESENSVNSFDPETAAPRKRFYVVLENLAEA